MSREKSVIITDMAAAKIKSIAEAQNVKNIGLRISLIRTHCMGGRGYAYELMLEDSPRPNDEVLETDLIKIYLHTDDLRYMRGIVVDYQDGEFQQGFAIRNPNAVAKCPCGHHDIFEPAHIGYTQGGESPGEGSCLPDGS